MAVLCASPIGRPSKLPHAVGKLRSNATACLLFANLRAAADARASRAGPVHVCVSTTGRWQAPGRPRVLVAQAPGWPMAEAERTACVPSCFPARGFYVPQQRRPLAQLSWAVGAHMERKYGGPHTCGGRTVRTWTRRAVVHLHVSRLWDRVGKKHVTAGGSRSATGHSAQRGDTRGNPAGSRAGGAKSSTASPTPTRAREGTGTIPIARNPFRDIDLPAERPRLAPGHRV